MSLYQCRTVVSALLSLLILGQALGQVAPLREEKGYRIPLAWLMPKIEPVRLMGQMDRHTFVLPIPERWITVSARLSLHYRNSLHDLRTRSQLRVLLDGFVIAQRVLDPAKTKGVLEVSLPVEYLGPGYHNLAVEAVQHYRLFCEDSQASELWTQIEVLDSFITFEGEHPPIRPTLADLDAFFDPKIWSNTMDLQVLYGGPWNETLQEAAALAVEGAALRLRYRLPRIRLTSIAQPLQGDALIVGIREHLEGHVPKEVLKSVAGPSLAVFAQEEDRTRFVLVITGRTPEEVREAALVFAANRVIWPESSFAHTRLLAPASLPEETAFQWVRPGRRYYFSELGLDTSSREGGYGAPMELSFWVPADLFAPRGGELEIGLHTAFGAGMGRASSLWVELNGHFERAIPFDDPKGGVYRDYSFSIPLNSLKPGLNVLSFRSRLVPPPEGGECIPPPQAGLVVTLFGDSELRMSDYGTYAMLPDLGLLGKTGFPLIGSPPAPLSVQVTAPEAYAVAFQVLARLSQMAGVPLEHAHFTDDLQGNALVVGTPSTLPKGFLSQAPVRFYGERLRVSPPELVQAQGQPWAWWPAWPPIKDGVSLGPFPAGYPIGLIMEPWRGWAMMTAFQAPWQDGKTVVLLIGTDASLSRAGEDLADIAFWGRLSGDTVWWNERSFHSARLSAPYPVGEKDFLFWVFLFSEMPGLWIGLVIGILLLWALLLVIGMRRRYRRWANEKAQTGP